MHQNVAGHVLKKYFDIFSSCLTHRSWFVIHALKKVFEHAEFQALNLKKLSLWMDGGKHFRSGELYAFLAKPPGGLDITWHHFCPYHGKCLCDQRFAKISSFMKQVRFVISCFFFFFLCLLFLFVFVSLFFFDDFFGHIAHKQQAL